MQSTEIVYCFQTLKLNPIEYVRFTNCCEKSNKETYTLAQWHMIGHWQWANRKHFLSARRNIWSFNVALINKTICLLKHRCFGRLLLLLVVCLHLSYTLEKLKYLRFLLSNYIPEKFKVSKKVVVFSIYILRKF